MAKITAILATWQKTRQGRARVYVRVSQDGKRKLKATDVYVTERQWNARQGRVRDSVPGSERLNEKIARLIHRAEQLQARRELEGFAVTIDDLMRAMDDAEAPRNKPPASILDEYREFVATKRARFRPNTVKVYEALQTHLEEWLSAEDPVSDVHAEFLNELATFLLAKGLGNVTVNKYLKRARGFALWLERRGMIDRTPPRENLPTAQNPAVYLTLEELNQVMRCDLSGRPPGYRDARDLFIAEAMTGQRFSDLQAMRWEEIDLNGGWWNSPTIKTAATTRVPLAAPVRRIIEARAGDELSPRRPTPLPRLSNQKTNQYIKAVCEIAGINEPVTTQKLKGAAREVTTRPKHELVTTHTARRTFVTLALQNDVPVTALLGLTHDDLRTLRLYAGHSDREREKHVNRLFGGL